MIGADKVAAIRAKAEALAGRSLGDHGTALTEMTAGAAMAWCNREDIPEDMEQAVAALALSMEGGEGGAVKSVTRGDTSVTYAVGDSGSPALAGLAPWRRLGRLGRDDP
mgnify:CR=1 FL=1